MRDRTVRAPAWNTENHGPHPELCAAIRIIEYRSLQMPTSDRYFVLSIVDSMPDGATPAGRAPGTEIKGQSS